MTISFSEIPTTRIPGNYVELNTRLQARGLPISEAKVILVGQQMGSGSATAGTLVQIQSDEDAASLFGRGSLLHRMAIGALTANRYMASLHGIGLGDNVAGVKAAGTFTFVVGTLTSGTLKVWIGHDYVSIVLAGTENANAIALSVRAALSAAVDMPIVPTVLANQVTITAIHKGTLGNQLDLATEYTGTGLTVTTVPMASGAGDPDPDDALDVIFSVDADVIVFPWNDGTNLDKLAAHLTARSDGVEQRGAVGVTAKDDTISALTTITTGQNHPRISYAGLEGTKTWAPEIAAAYAAAIAGEPDLARPLNDVVLTGIYPPLDATRYTRSELTTLLANGVAPLIVNANEDVTICRSIATYYQDDDGQADDTLLDLQTIRVLDFVRKSVKQRFSDRFSQVKIAAVAHTENTTDTSKIKVEILDVLMALEGVDYIENVDDNKDDVNVERNANNTSRVDCKIPSDVVNGLHVLAARIDLIL